MIRALGYNLICELSRRNDKTKVREAKLYSADSSENPIDLSHKFNRYAYQSYATAFYEVSRYSLSHLLFIKRIIPPPDGVDLKFIKNWVARQKNGPNVEGARADVLLHNHHLEEAS